MIGIEEATENWESMDLTVQKEFYERFKKQATEHFGEDILYGSFTKVNKLLNYVSHALARRQI